MNIHLKLVLFTILLICGFYIFFGHDKPRLEKKIEYTPKVEKYKTIMCLTPDNVEIPCKG